MRQAVIVDGFRTAFCKAGTEFKNVQPDTLGALAVKEAIKRLSRLDLCPSDIDFVIGSNVGTPANALNIARVAAIKGGLPESIPADTLSKNCGSGIAAVNWGWLKIASGQADVVLVVGVESMSNAPLLYSEELRKNYAVLMTAKSAWQKAAIITKIQAKQMQLWNKEYKPQSALMLGLTDPLCGKIMGLTVEILASSGFDITRDKQDAFALWSNTKAAKAQKAGLFDNEIAPLYVRDSRGHKHVSRDNGIRENQTMEALGRLRPNFDKKYGTITAGNSSQVTDGAACILLMAEEKAKALSVPVKGRVVNYTDVGIEPLHMGLGPAKTIAKILAITKMSLKNFSVIEINEAFAAQTLACLETMESDLLMKKWFGNQGFDKALGEITDEQLNPRGGAIALGHPVGVTGMRLIITALDELSRRGDELAIVSACIGGGQGNAMILERRR